MNFLAFKKLYKIGNALKQLVTKQGIAPIEHDYQCKTYMKLYS
jgi:hypothetical protein